VEVVLTSTLDGSEWSASHPGRFTPKEKAPGWRGGWVGPRAVLDAVAKRKIPSPRRESNAPIVQSVAQRYTTELSRLLTYNKCFWNSRCKILGIIFQKFHNRFYFTFLENWVRGFDDLQEAFKKQVHTHPAEYNSNSRQECNKHVNSHQSLFNFS
jgi:hypothetical protein